jgi:hypothetical protein
MTDTESFKSYESAKSHAEFHPPLLDDYDFNIVETELNDSENSLNSVTLTN